MSDLRNGLRALPKDLDDTYSRILQDIDSKGYGDQVVKILQWLAYSARPMFIKEIAEVLTVDMESEPLVDFEKRLEDPQDLFEICSSLVSIGPKNWNGEETFQFAHFSVREFLESPRLNSGPARKFAVDKMRANTLIAESCIAYNMNLDSLQVDMHRSIIREKYPLFAYAEKSWDSHARRARENGRIISLIERVFRSQDSKPPIWIGDDLLDFTDRFTDPQGRLMPLHCAVFIPLPKIMRKLILEGAHVNSKSKSGNTPLIMVSKMWERVEDVQFLLSHGAEVNACDDEGCTALMHASQEGFIQTVRILLDNGADVNMHDVYGSTALIFASSIGARQTVQALLDSGADLEAQNMDGETALFFASLGRNIKIVQLLLGRGASINSPSGEKALAIASLRGYSQIVQILLDRGVNVDASCKYEQTTCTALIRAVADQQYETADLLTKNGADVNARSSTGNRDAVLLEHVIMESFEDGDEKQLAKVFRFLIEHGADPKLVRTDHMNLEQKERYREWLSEFNITLSLE